MKIVNRTGGPLTIKEIQSDQSKVKADAPLQTYEDGEGFQLTYRLDVAKNSPHSFANIRLICDGSLKLIKIPMEVQVHNVAAFFLPSYSFSSDAHQPTKLKLRVILTGELQGSDVRVTGTGDLAHLPWKIVRETDQLNIGDFAVAELAADEIPPIGILETVTIECLKSKLTNQTRVQVFYNGAFRIAPNVVHLRSDPVGKSLAGNLVIALTSLRDIGVNRSSDVSVSARLNDTVPCKVDKQVMGDSSLRIRIKVDPEAIKEIPVDAMFVSVDIHGNRVKIPVKVR
jgi:hypothetical protein